MWQWLYLCELLCETGSLTFPALETGTGQGEGKAISPQRKKKWRLWTIAWTVNFYTLHIWTRQTNQRGKKERRHRNQKPTYSHTQEFQSSTKLKALIYLQRIWCRPVQALCFCFSLCEFTGPLLILFSLCPWSPLAPTFLLSPLPRDSLSSEGKDLI